MRRAFLHFRLTNSESGNSEVFSIHLISSEERRQDLALRRAGTHLGVNIHAVSPVDTSGHSAIIVVAIIWVAWTITRMNEGYRRGVQELLSNSLCS